MAASCAPIARMPKSPRSMRVRPCRARACAPCSPATTWCAPASRTPRPLAHFKGKDGTALKVPHRHALAHGRVRFVGEPVALVVADSETAAQDAAERIVVSYRDLPAVIDAADALAAGAPQLHADVPGNLAVDYEYGNRAATEAAFASAHRVVRVTVEAQRIAANPMEPKSCLAACDPATGICDLYLPTQGAADVRKEFAYITDGELERLRVHSQDVGGAFGVRNEIYPEFTALLMAAKLIGRPVKWTGTRAETILGDHHARAIALTGEVALDAEGTFLAMRVEWLVNLGAYCSNAGPFISTGASPTSMAVNTYKTPAFYGLNRLVFTNTTPTTAYRGAGRPSVSYLVERLVDEAARVTGIDRIKLRLRNLLPKKAFPYKTPTGFTYDSGDPPGLLRQALDVADWRGFERRRREAKRRGKLRGIGCATFIEPSGGGGQEEVALRFDAVGRVAALRPGRAVRPRPRNGVSRSGRRDSRHGARGRDLALQRSGGAGAGGHGLVRLALAHQPWQRLVGRRARSSGARAWNWRRRSSRSRPAISSSSAAATACRAPICRSACRSWRASMPAAPSHPLDTVAKINTAGAFPSGAHIAEVEVDPDTGAIELISLCGGRRLRARRQPHPGRRAAARRGHAGHRPDPRRALRL